MTDDAQTPLPERVRRVLQSAQAAAQPDVSTDERKHVIEDLDQLGEALSARERELEREQAWIATTRQEIDRTASRVRRAGEQPDAWMWTDGVHTVVDPDGHRWVRLRSWERDPETRAWMCVPYDYEYCEQDDAFFALKAQLGVWKTVAPVLVKDKPWPTQLDHLAEDSYPDTAARLAQAAPVRGPYYQVRIVSHVSVPSGRQRAEKPEGTVRQPRRGRSRKDTSKD